MKVYSARQAILNRKKNVVAYELFFRDSAENVFPQIDSHLATSKLILRTHLNDGLFEHTSGKPAFINLSEQSLLQGLPKLLPAKGVVFEILEDVTPSDAVYEAIRELYHSGYHMVLDDFIYKPEWVRFFKFVKMIKFDISQTPPEKIKKLVAKLSEYKNIRLLAEKVETQEEFEQCKKMGFHFFQGYFFCRPEMRESKDISTDKITLLNIYREVLKPELNINRIAKYFTQNVNLTYKLLRFINSGVLPITAEINSIKQALVYMGEEQTRKFVILLVTATETIDKPKELINVAIIRARFCELMAQEIDYQDTNGAFLTGLFSLLDALLDRPMENILEQLPLSESIKDALRQEKFTKKGTFVKAIERYEQGHWYLTQQAVQSIGLTYDHVAKCYKDAICWVDNYDKAVSSSQGTEPSLEDESSADVNVS